METNNNSNDNIEKSFKSWFKIMWQNFFIQLFVGFFTILIIELFNFDWCVNAFNDAKSDGIPATIFACFGLALPLAGAIIVGYKGLWQYWRDLMTGKNR